jgi:hypothetical protein
MVGFNESFVCRAARPAIRCDYYEMYVLGILVFLNVIASLYSLYSYASKSQRGFTLCDHATLFWVFMAVFQLYLTIMFIAPIPWTLTSLQICRLTVSYLLMLITMCLLILILFDLLFTYRNPGTNSVIFFRYFLLIFLLVTVALGVCLSILDIKNEADVDKSLSLWAACSDLVLVIFVFLPARKLLRTITYPSVRPEEVGCIRFCWVGLTLFCVLFSGRILWNVTHYFDANVVEKFMAKDLSKGGLRLAGGQRAVSFFFYFCFDWMTSVLAVVIVSLLKKHDLMFNENPYYSHHDR